MSAAASQDGARARSPRATWLGLSAFVALAATFLGPYVLGKLNGLDERRRAAAEGPAHGAAHVDDRAHAEMEAARATSALASLTSALSALSDVRAKASETDAPVVPPRPEDFPSATACMRTYLPEVDVADSSLDGLCEETDAWAAERSLYARLSHRRGGEAWTRLGRHTMLAVAMMRSGCCVAPKPLTAVLPGLWCGVLRDELGAVGPAPDDSEVKSYERVMRCLDARGTHLPERWKSRPEWITDRAFASLLDVARDRKRR